MPFNSEVRTESLVRAARHCCVCHRYKGLKVEVHHIIQEADDGPNTLENAITLCADCHTDAGHYNDRHPRGTKFRPDELRRARDRWHELVASGFATQSADAGSLYCRYLLCKNFESIREICSGNLSDFPFKNSLLVRTPALDFLTSIVKKTPESYRHSKQWGGSFQSETEYVQAHADAKKSDEISGHSGYGLRYQRNPTVEEIQKNVADADYVTAQLLKTKLPPTEICRVSACTDGCGDVLLQEEYQLRPLWAVYLVVTNDSSRRVGFKRLDAMGANLEEPLRLVSGSSPDGLSPIHISLPPVEIAAQATCIFPIATVLGPIGEVLEERMWTDDATVSSGQMQEVSHGGILHPSKLDCLYWGPILSNPSLVFAVEDKECFQDIHGFDLDNLYLLDRHWMMGSCPHVFEISESGTVTYLGEIFTGQAGVFETVVIKAGEDAAFLVVAELEDETTFVDSVCLSNCVVLEKVLLEKGEYVRVPVNGGAEISIKGNYKLLSSPPKHAQKDMNRVRSLVHSFGIELGLARGSEFQGKFLEL
ncbi:MAG: HNH endonuclease [Pseudomonadota bacterium]